MTGKKTPPFRVLYVIQVFYPSQAGGPANSVYWATKHIDKGRVFPVIVSGDKGLDVSVERNRWRSTEAGRIIYVHNRVERMSIRQALVAFRELPGVDAINLSSLFYPPSLFIGIVGRLLGKKILWTAHGELDKPALKLSGRRKKKAAVKFLRWFFGQRVLYHSTSDLETENIRAALGQNVRIIEIPNYMEIPPPVNEPKGDYILYIGRLHEKKGLEKLLKALVSSDKFHSSGLMLKIAGVGQPIFENKLRSLVSLLGLENRVNFLGEVVGDEKQKLLGSARFTIVPSECENFGIVVPESLAQGTPVIASTGTPWASVADEKVGLWVDNSPESLAAAIDRMLSLDENEYIKYCSRARSFVEARFAIEDHIGEWHDAYDLLLNRQGGRIPMK